MSKGGILKQTFGDIIAPILESLELKRATGIHSPLPPVKLFSLGEIDTLFLDDQGLVLDLGSQIAGPLIDLQCANYPCRRHQACQKSALSWI